MNKKIIILILVVFCVGLIVVSSASAVSASKQTISIKNGMNNLLSGYSETALNGKLQLSVDSNLRAHISISNYKKLISLKVKCYFLSRTTNFNAYGRPSYSSYQIDRRQFPNGYTTIVSSKNVTKTSKGYNYGHDFSYAMTGAFSNPGVIYALELEFEDQPDLTISKISKKGTKHVVTVKNIGDANAKANKMGIFVGKKRIKTVSVSALKPGQSKNVNVKLPSKYSKNTKTFKLDYNNKIDEVYKDNNSKKAR